MIRPYPGTPFFLLGGVGGGVKILAPKCRTIGAESKITLQRLLDQSKAGPYMGEMPLTPLLGLFGAIRVPYPKGLNCWFTPL